MIRQALLVALLFGACTESATPRVAVAELDEGALAPVLRVGDRHVYTLAWHAEASRTGAGMRVSGSLALEGELAVSVLAAGPEGTRVSLSFPSLSVRELRVQDGPIEIDAAMLVGHHAEILVAADGDVRRAFFDGNAPPVFRELMTGVIARLDLRGADPDVSPRAIRSGHGLVEATYHPGPGPGNVVTRELGRVLRFDTAPGTTPDAKLLVAEGRIELDDDRVPTVIELHDAIDAPIEIGLVADDRFSLARVRVERGDAVALAVALIDPVEIDPTAAPDQQAVDRELDRQYAGDLTMQDISIALSVADGGLQPASGEFSRAAALLRGWPERADEIVPLVMRSDGGGRQLAFDMLSAAGTPEAQATMRELLSEPASQWWPERVVLVQRFAFVSAPDDASGEFLLAMLDVAEDAEDLELQRATMHPMGAVAGRLDNPWLAERLHHRLVAAAAYEEPLLRAGAIAGLGNAKRRDDVPRFLAAAVDVDANVRLEALSALRFWIAPDTTAALLDALADENPAVGSLALDVLRKRHFDGESDPRLAERARDGRYNPELDRAVASSLIGDDAPTTLVALAAIAARTQNRELALELAQVR